MAKSFLFLGLFRAYYTYVDLRFVSLANNPRVVWQVMSAMRDLLGAYTKEEEEVYNLP